MYPLKKGSNFVERKATNLMEADFLIASKDKTFTSEEALEIFKELIKGFVRYEFKEDKLWVYYTRSTVRFHHIVIGQFYLKWHYDPIIPPNTGSKIRIFTMDQRSIFK